jgi:hypothetical protein
MRSKDDIIRWTELESKAMETRGDALEIYEVKAEKGESTCVYQNVVTLLMFFLRCGSLET